MSQGWFFFCHIYISPRLLQICKDALTIALEKQMTCRAEPRQGCTPSSALKLSTACCWIWSNAGPAGTRLDPQLCKRSKETVVDPHTRLASPSDPQITQTESPGEYGLYTEGRLARAAYTWHEQASGSSKAKVEAFTTIPPSRLTAAAGQSHYSSLAVLVSISDPVSAAGGSSARCSAPRCWAHLLPQIYCSS